MFTHHTASRKNQAEKIHMIVTDFLKHNELSHMNCLEVGCGKGEISAYFSELVKNIWGIDINKKIIMKSQINQGNLGFSQANGTNLPFESSFFDLVLFPQVYEHTLNQQLVINEIHRVLRPGGICFFSGPNRFRIIESHYFLPFLSWLPHKLASLYLRIMGKGEVFDIYPRNYWYINKLMKGFTKHDYTYKMIKDPEYYKIKNRFGPWKFNVLPTFIVKGLEPLFPNYNWILQKENEKYSHSPF